MGRDLWSRKQAGPHSSEALKPENGSTGHRHRRWLPEETGNGLCSQSFIDVKEPDNESIAAGVVKLSGGLGASTVIIWTSNNRA